MVFVTERWDSRRTIDSRDGKQSTFDLICTVHDTTSDEVALAAVRAFAPLVRGDSPRLWRQSIDLEPVGHDVWTATVRYDTSAPESPNANDSFEFDTTGGTQHITNSYATMAAHGLVEDFGGAIGVSDSGVEGTEIVVPSFRFSETHFYPEVSVGDRFVWANLTGTINTFPFKGFAAGEVLFLGASGRKVENQDERPWSVTLSFACQANRSNFSIGGILVPFQYGWDHRWVRYATVAGSRSLLKVPIAVYIERVYRDTDFGQLGIGT